MTRRLAILASGGGSNANNILDYFQNSETVEIACIGCNKEGAGAFDVANKWHIPAFLLTRENFLESEDFLEYLEAQEVDFIVLAGFLWKVPASLSDCKHSPRFASKIWRKRNVRSPRTRGCFCK